MNFLGSTRNRLAAEESGFSLIELLVVVLIIGVLAAIMIPRFISQRDSAKNSAAISDLVTAETALETYFTLNGETFGANEADTVSVMSASTTGEPGLAWKNAATTPVSTSGNSNTKSTAYIYEVTSGRYGGVLVCVGSQGTKNYCAVVFGNDATRKFTITGTSNGFAASATPAISAGTPASSATWTMPTPGTSAITWTEGDWKP